jgi:hypothetical protein
LSVADVLLLVLRTDSPCPLSAEFKLAAKATELGDIERKAARGGGESVSTSISSGEAAMAILSRSVGSERSSEPQGCADIHDEEEKLIKWRSTISIRLRRMVRVNR